jgi:hypothetical protein
MGTLFIIGQLDLSGEKTTVAPRRLVILRESVSTAFSLYSPEVPFVFFASVKYLESQPLAQSRGSTGTYEVHNSMFRQALSHGSNQ